MLAIDLVNSDQKISNIGPCPNCPADTVLDMDFWTFCVCQKSPGQRPCTTLQKCVGPPLAAFILCDLTTLDIVL
ncbi:14037_t:CDS:2 [Funneliformis geosporum]|uniref:14037_t:CDS:1 n=1 Tax=Funneliformis geosporum TaxID=1117311 RepID=A0A9W4WT38_9GLOM|nr:14037_t:CDS:2 [Funneliformis geosporum]